MGVFLLKLRLLPEIAGLYALVLGRASELTIPGRVRPKCRDPILLFARKSWIQWHFLPGIAGFGDAYRQKYFRRVEIPRRKQLDYIRFCWSPTET